MVIYNSARLIVSLMVTAKQLNCKKCGPKRFCTADLWMFYGLKWFEKTFFYNVFGDKLFPAAAGEKLSCALPLTWTLV